MAGINTGTDAGEEDYVLSDWQRFFSELSVFLDTADRQLTTANQAYSEYVIEQLQRALVRYT